MKLFVKCQRNGSDWYASYQGHDQETVTRLLTELGATNIQFITEDEWTAAQTDSSEKRSQSRDPGEADQHQAETLGLTNTQT